MTQRLSLGTLLACQSHASGMVSLRGDYPGPAFRSRAVWPKIVQGNDEDTVTAEYEVVRSALPILFAAIAPALGGAHAGDLRPSTVTPPIIVSPPAQPAEKVPPDAFYDDFARRVAVLTEQERAELVKDLRARAERAKAAGKFGEAAHYYRLLDAVTQR